jgi:hypothetical protein
MKKDNEIKQLSVSERLRNSEMLGAKVAKIVNKARAQANKILAETGCGVNITVDFYNLDEPIKNEEVTNG